MLTKRGKNTNHELEYTLSNGFGAQFVYIWKRSVALHENVGRFLARRRK